MGYKKEPEVRALTLEYKSDGSSTLFRLEHGWTLLFKLGPSLLGKKVKLFTNYPINENDVCFERTKYYEVTWEHDGTNVKDDTCKLAKIVLLLGGSFHYYLVDQSGEKCGSGYFLVEPNLTVGIKKKTLPLDCIQCQSVLTKNLGPFPTWEGRLKVAKESGYNMIHFTPLQEIGGSNSCYSLSNHQELDGRYKTTWDEVEKLVCHMNNDWEMLSISDIVLNHTANESLWIKDHPECTYNCLNTPNLRPAFLLDQMFFKVTKDIENGAWKKSGIPEGVISTYEQLEKIKEIIWTDYLPKQNFFEFYMIDVDAIIKKFEETMPDDSHERSSNIQSSDLKIIQDPEYKRFGSSINLKMAYDLVGSDVEHLRYVLNELNKKMRITILGHLNEAVENVIKGAVYERLDESGPRIKKCDVKHPLARDYFTNPNPNEDLASLEKMMYTQEGSFFMAHNGWVMGLDPMINFTSSKCNVYLRRELVAWGDSVKLNYGEKESDSPFLWNFMKEYIERTAKIFHGIRLDNCHSTPIHVAEYLLDCARRIRPDLYVIAELFTGSEHYDNIFLNRLGISSMIREALQAWDSHEQGRLLHRFGADPVGAFFQPTNRPLMPAMAHAILFDQTHDNPSYAEKRTVLDVLPSAALVNMACCATGSNRGYDEMVPHHIHVVDETRLYTAFRDPSAKNDSKLEITQESGIIAAKKVMQDLHLFLGMNGFTQLYVDQMSPDVVAVTRHCPDTHQSVITVASTAFHQGVIYFPLKLRVEGQLIHVAYEASLKLKEGDAAKEKFIQDKDVINGLNNYTCQVKTKFPISKSEMARLESEDNLRTVIELHGLTPGSAISFFFQLPSTQSKACQSIRNFLADDDVLKSKCQSLDLNDMNRILFRCDQEEREDGDGGVYVLDGYTPTYAGLQGFMTLLSEIRPINDLGNWLPSNLRNGDWLLDYIVSRLKRENASDACKKFSFWVEIEIFSLLKAIPRYLIPCYFDAVYTKLYCALLDRSWSIMSRFVNEGSTFVKFLSLGSIQHAAALDSAPLPKLSPNLKLKSKTTSNVSCAAGLPHFSTGYMRNWGRDTFISLPGLFILTGRREEARVIILSFGGCLRHGLIPNLLDGGRNARFNCRDAFWWWLYCIKVYVNSFSNGEAILKDPVLRLFPRDDMSNNNNVVEQPLEDVIQEGLQKHFQGLKFREWNAGTRIDAHMKDEGFNNEIGVDLETGFVYGGNVWNCGTWMDKMGSSDKCGNRGKPSTPRDGSAVELVGLSFACLKWLAKEVEKGHYTHKTVMKIQDGYEHQWSFEKWAEKIKENFEKYFYVVRNNPVDRNPHLINKLGIYKDTLNSGLPWSDYQLRCNFPIAMAVAPELFDPEHAWNALKIVKEKLLGPLGIATLDPDDWTYRGDYDNSNDSDDPTVAHGANYHQGPEWVWPVGFFLRAYLKFGQNYDTNVAGTVMGILSEHYAEVQSSKWRGIPELTNSHGKFCRDSNPTQAWSFATLMEVLAELENYDNGSN